MAVNTNNANNADANVNNAGANIVIAMPGNQKRITKFNNALRGNEKIIKKCNARLSQKMYNKKMQFQVITKKIKKCNAKRK